MVKFTNIVALGLVLAGISTTASPVINEQRDIERRTTSLSCGWAKKDGVDMGCMCNLPGLNLNLDLGGLDILSLGLKQYPPGCKPTCDDKVYECPHGSNGHGGCNEPMACPPNHCESYGKCCPYGTTNMNGVCCPKGCVNKDGRCYVPHPEPQCPEHSTYSQHEKKCVCDNHEFEMFDHKCVPKCDTDKKRNDQGHCECKEYGFKPDEHGVCRPQCTHPKELDLHENRCECPEHLVDDGKGGCKTPPPTCYHPKKLNDEKNACVCKEHLIDDGMGGCKKKPPVCTGGKMLNYKDECVCPEHQYEDKHGMCFTPPTCTHPFVLSGDKKSCVCEKNFYEEHGTCKPKPVDCGWGKKWCKTKCCRNDQEEKGDGQCGCPEGWKELPLLRICKKISVLGIGL